MVTFDSLTTPNSNNIRKAGKGAVFVAPYSSTVPASITSTSAASLIALPAGYKDLGRTDVAGAAFSRAITSQDVTSWGPAEPTRSDFTGDIGSLHVVAQETKLLTLELFTGQDLSAIMADHITNEVQWVKPELPITTYWRVLVLAVDNDITTGLEIYMARLFLKAKVSAVADQTWAGSGPVVYDLTFEAARDDNATPVPTAQKDYMGGPGFSPTAAGFTVASSLVGLGVAPLGVDALGA